MTVTPAQCSQSVLDVVPTVMRFIRSQMRNYRGAGLSVPQFRTLLFVNRNEGASLGDLAEHLGLTPPSASKQVAELVNRRLLRRRIAKVDRRRISLAITSAGSLLLEAALEETHRKLSAALAALRPVDLMTVSLAMAALRNTFAVPARPSS
jgi:DNA-binding MarR family transcriptional regulator